MANPKDDPPFEGGAQPVPEHRPEVPTRGRSVGQVVVVVIGVLVILAAIFWFLIPLGGTGAP